jgi:hypothetical protein
MTTIAEIAREFRMQPYELRAFADDLLNDLTDNDEVPATTETILREALNTEDRDDLRATARENDQMDHAADTLAQIEIESGWLDSQEIRPE